MGKYDLPAVINFVLSKTKVKDITYIGHSQGTSQMFAALTIDPDYFRKKLNLIILLAPVARVDSAESRTVQDMAKNMNAVSFIEMMGPEVLPSP
jgi:lysosomal acid lipase/cholesteryl ester hydrolase